MCSSDLLGALVLQTKALLQGKDPMDMTPDDAHGGKFWAKALAQGGSLSFVADALLADPADGNTRTWENKLGLAGPVAGAVGGALDVGPENVRQWLQGKDTNLGPEALRWINSQLPGVSLWQIRTLWQRAVIFLRRVGGIIFTLMVLLWFLSTYPAPPADWTEAQGPAILYSAAGMMGQALQHVFSPLGFNWQISIALVPGMAAREVAVGALGTVYSLSAADNAMADALSPVIAQGWSLATAYSLLAWFVFAPQCLSTLAVVRRETNSLRYPLLMAAYLFALAYAAAFVTYRTTLWLGA